MIIKTAEEGRNAQKHGRGFAFTPETLRMVHEVMQYFGVYGADDEETILMWATNLIVENYNWPGSLPIDEVLIRFKRAAQSQLYGTEAKSPEKLIIMFRKWIDEGDRRVELFDAIQGKKVKPSVRVEGERIEDWEPEEVKRIYGVVRMIGVKYTTDVFRGLAMPIARLQKRHEELFGVEGRNRGVE